MATSQPTTVAGSGAREQAQMRRPISESKILGRKPEATIRVACISRHGYRSLEMSMPRSLRVLRTNLLPEIIRPQWSTTVESVRKRLSGSGALEDVENSCSVTLIPGTEALDLHLPSHGVFGPGDRTKKSGVIPDLFQLRIGSKPVGLGVKLKNPVCNRYAIWAVP